MLVNFNTTRFHLIYEFFAPVFFEVYADICRHCSHFCFLDGSPEVSKSINYPLAHTSVEPNVYCSKS